MEPVFSNKLDVRLNEVDYRGKVKISHIFNWFQNLSSLHSSFVGYPVTELIKKNLTWVVTRYHIKIDSYPLWRQKISISTWRSGERNNFAPREFKVLDEKDNTIIICSASFKLIDLKNRLVVSPKKFLPDYPILEKRVIDDNFESFESLDYANIQKEFQIRKSDIDINRHVNNTLYIEWALETVPDEIYDNLDIKELEISFKKEAFINDTIISKCQKKDNKIFVHNILRKKDNKILAKLKTYWA